MQHVRLHDDRPGRARAAREHGARLQQERPQVSGVPIPGEERHVPDEAREGGARQVEPLQGKKLLHFSEEKGGAAGGWMTDDQVLVRLGQ